MSFFVDMTEIILAIITITTIILSYVERKQMQDRLMAKSLEDYKNTTEKPEKNELPTDDTGIPLEDARELIDG